MAPKATTQKGTLPSTSNNKTLVIGAVTVIAILILGGLLFINFRAVGKAIGTTSESGNANIILGDTPGQIIIQANSGTEAITGVEFDLQSTDVDLCGMGVVLTSQFNVMPEQNCAGGVFHYAAAARLGEQPSGIVDLAIITLPMPPPSAQFHFNTLEVQDSYLDNIVTGDINSPITISFRDDSEPVVSMTVSSSAFTDGGTIPAQYACGDNGMSSGLSLPLTISNIPSDVSSLTIIMEDLDYLIDGIRPAVHWALVDIPVTSDFFTLEAGVIPDGAGSVLNDFDTYDYFGPCPPAEDASHRYQIIVFALQDAVTVSDSVLGSSDVAAQSPLATASLIASYDIPTTSLCGDGVVDAGEECDGSNVGDSSCTVLGFAGGDLSCTMGCRFDASGCTSEIPEPLTCTEDTCRSTFNLIDLTQCPLGDTCQTVDELFAGLTPEGRTEMCGLYGIAATTCPGTSTFNANINGDDVIDDRDALFIYQAIEAKQSAYNYCGAVRQPPCVFGDRVICEDVSFRWTSLTTIASPPALPSPLTSTTLQNAGIVCGNLGGESS